MAELMRYYPVFLDIRGKRCAVVGGGKVAERKALGLLSAGALVSVISPRLTVRLKGLALAGKVEHISRRFEKGCLKGAAIVIAASDSKDVNAAVFKEAARRGIPVNTVDDPALCSFIVPSAIERGDLTIAISTGGKAPALAKRVREYLEKIIGMEYALFTEIIGAARNNLLKRGVNRVKKERVINALIDSPLLDLIRANDRTKIDALLKNLLGEGFSSSPASDMRGQAPIKAKK
ncbi:MAG: bifunctional precorrin-2 dehydrogenase/sirohydrochlorin ferrochelatase [Deltaproteobacteria bacterium]|nr:bifunctional precorrin-2 dehydrogenase/sirohydrochlorin ferrochelatase [Deltaproteobacteria bacterium]